MTGLPWFKCYPRDFNDGMMGLTMEERGAYVTILNCIYQRGTPVHDDALYFRAMLQCSGKTWAKVRASLIFKGRLFEVCVNGKPCLMDERAAVEIEKNLEMRRELSERGARGGRKSRSTLKETNDLAQAPAQAEVKPGSSDTEAESEVDSTTVTNVPVVPRKRGAKFVPASWEPKPAHALKAQTLGLDLHEQAAAFRDFEFRDAKSDFDLAFHRWLRNARNFNHAKPDKLTARHENYAASWAGSEQALGIVAARRAF